MGSPASSDRLSRERILDAAWSIAADEGLDRVSMRRIAAALHTGPMSLYNHLADKDAVLVGLLDRMFGLVEVPDEGSWEDVVDGWAQSVRSTIAANRHLVPLLAAGLRPGALADLGARLVAALARSGLSAAQSVEVAQAVGRYLAGSVLLDGASMRHGVSDTAALDRAFDRGLEALVLGLRTQMT